MEKEWSQSSLPVLRKMQKAAQNYPKMAKVDFFPLSQYVRKTATALIFLKKRPPPFQWLKNSSVLVWTCFPLLKSFGLTPSWFWQILLMLCSLHHLLRWHVGKNVPKCFCHSRVDCWSYNRPQYYLGPLDLLLPPARQLSAFWTGYLFLQKVFNVNKREGVAILLFDYNLWVGVGN